MPTFVKSHRRGKSVVKAYSRKVTTERKLMLHNKISKRYFGAKLKGSADVMRLSSMKERAATLLLAGPLGKRALGGYLQGYVHRNAKGLEIGTYSRGRGKKKFR